MQTDTPRTDEHATKLGEPWIDFARQLERELSETTKKGRKQGRAEFLHILLGLDPEDIDEYIGSRPLADTGDYTSYWKEQELVALFDAEVDSSVIDHLDSEFWKHTYTLQGVRDLLQRVVDGHPDVVKEAEEWLTSGTF